MKINKGKINKIVLFLCLAVSFFLVSTNVFAAEVTPGKFVDRLKLKFRRTASIYLEAEAIQLPDRTDTSTIVLAYSYPDQFLQWVKGAGNREQVLIMNGDSVVLYYPHLETETRRSLNQKQRLQILVREVPLAAMMLGVQSDSVPLEDIQTELDNGYLKVEFINNNPGIPYRRGEAIFDWPALDPLYFIIETELSFAIEITEYEEETRFPRQIESAIYNLDPQLLKGEKP
jgi:hypothetical protein